MSKAQQLVNLMRQGFIFDILDFVSHVNDKYTPLCTLIPADDLVQLGIYELCSTDITEQDIPIINFLYNLTLQLDEEILGGKTGYLMVSFIGIVDATLSVKKDPQFSQVMVNTCLFDAGQLQDFCKEESLFAQLQKRAIVGEGYKKLLISPLNYGALLKECYKMDQAMFTNFKKNINRLELDLKENLERILAPVFTEEAYIDKLRVAVNQLKSHLENKKGTGDEVILEEHKKAKLHMRHIAISWVSEQLANKIHLSLELKFNIKNILHYMNKQHPTWLERGSQQKLTDLLSVGIKPLYRGFFSTERSYETAIARLFEHLEKTSVPETPESLTIK